MRTIGAALVLAALAAPALAHGGAFIEPPAGGGPPAAPGFGGSDAGGGATRWESWWADNREDVLRIAEHVDATRMLAVTPAAGETASPKDAARTRATFAAQVRESILPHLLWAVREADFDVRASAAIALGKLGDARGGDALRDCALRDERDEVRRAAVLGLGLLGRREELPFLCDLVANRRAEIDERSMAALAIGLVGGDDAATFLSFLLERDETRPDARVSSEAQLLGTVYEALGLTNSIEALRCLWRAADDDALDPLLRAHAVLGLGRFRDRDSADRFVKLVGPSTDQQLRRAAVMALGRVTEAQDVRSIQALSTLLATDRDPMARRFAITALGGVRAPAVRSVLRAQFAAAGDGERPFFAIALALQRDAMSAPAIREALTAARDESARSAYSTALGILADRDSVPALEQQIAPGPTPGTYRGFAALALAVMPSPESRDVLWKRLPEERDARVWGDYAVALGLLQDTRVRAFLTNALRSGDGNFDKCRAASCLGVLRRTDAVPELVEMLRNPRADGIVRSICVVALGQIGDPSPVPKLARLAAGGTSSLATRAIAEALTIL